MKAQRTLSLILFACLLLSAAVAQAGKIKVFVQLKEGHAETPEARQAVKHFRKAVVRKGLRSFKRKKGVDYVVKLKVNFEQSKDGAFANVSVLSKAYKPGLTTMTGYATGMADPYDPKDGKAAAKSLKQSSEQSANKLAGQLKQAAAMEKKKRKAKK